MDINHTSSESLRNNSPDETGKQSAVVEIPNHQAFFSSSLPISANPTPTTSFFSSKISKPRLGTYARSDSRTSLVSSNGGHFNEAFYHHSRPGSPLSYIHVPEYAVNQFL